MQFKALLALATLAAGQVIADISAEMIVDAIHVARDLSSDANDLVDRIDGSAVIVEVVPLFLDAYRDIGNAVIKDDALVGIARENKKPFTMDDEDDICQAYAEFVRFHRNLVFNIDSKYEELANSKYTIAVEASVDLVERSVTRFNKSMLELVPNCQDARGIRVTEDATRRR